MKEHFISGFVALSAILAASSHPASARDSALLAPSGTATWTPQSGKASYYGPAFDGRLAASGVRFDQMALTAAHMWLPFGTKVKVMLAGSSRSVIVTITDRLYSARRVVDLSLGAARELGMIHRGIAEVRLVPA